MVTFIDFTETIEMNVVKDFDVSTGAVHLGYDKEGPGGWATGIPISPPEYRAKSPTKASATVEETPNSITFNLTDDWGNTHKLIVDGDEMNNPIVQRELEKVKNGTF